VYLFYCFFVDNVVSKELEGYPADRPSNVGGPAYS